MLRADKPIASISTGSLPNTRDNATCSPARARRVRLFVIAVLFLASLVPMTFVMTANLSDLDNFHGDESLYIPVANKMVDLYWVKHDFTNPAWEDDFYTFGAINPQMGKYLMGAGSYLAGYRELPIRPGYQFRQSVAWNVEHGLVPPAGAVGASRLPIAMTGVCSLVLLYMFVTLLAGAEAGLLATWALFSGGLLISTSRHAMLDAPALAFSLACLCGLVVALRAIRAEHWRHAMMLSVIVGLLCGLAVGTKLNALLIIGVVGACFAAEWLAAWSNRRRQWWIIGCSVIAGVASIVIFYAINPYLWHHPAGGLKHLLSLNAVQASIGWDRTTTIPSKLVAVWHSLDQFGPFSWTGMNIDHWLLPVCALGLLAWLYRHPQQAWDRMYHVPAIWVAVVYGVTAAWLPHTWDRYFLPLAPINAMIEAMAIVGAAFVVRAWMRSWKRPAIATAAIPTPQHIPAALRPFSHARRTPYTPGSSRLGLALKSSIGWRSSVRPSDKG